MNEQDGPARIVVGVDGSDESRLALRWAARIAALEQATIDVVGVYDRPALVAWNIAPFSESGADSLRTIVTDTVAQVLGQPPPAGLTVHIEQGRPAPALLAAAKGARMIVLGSRGHGGFAGLLMGSVSTQVAEHAHCPVLVVHEHPDGNRADDTSGATP